MKTTYKTALVTKEYSIRFGGYVVVVPVGARVSNHTACGNDDSYRFWQDWQQQAKALTGFDRSMLAHDLTHYGLNVPAENCEAYKRET